jgi:hypothetical protein
MSQLDLPQNTILLGEHEYAEALDIVIATAERQLLIFDQNLVKGDFASVKRFDLIHAYLNKSALSKLTIILHYSDFFTSQCPRLYHLLATFSHKLTIYETNDFAKIAKDCFVLADDHAYIRRFHIDQSRFTYALDDEETTTSLKGRFDELLQETSQMLSTTKLGL